MNAPRSILRALALGACLLSTACRHAGRFVWVDDYRSADAAAADPGYLLGPGDLLSIRVLNHDEMSGRVRVRSDGRISLPFLDDLAVVGKKPSALAAKLRADLKEFVNNPVVTVTVEEPKPFTVSVTGEVMRPGVYPLDPTAGVLQALASAGGLSQFAHDDQIYVIRKEVASEAPVRIRFRYESLAHAEGQGASFALQRNDVVVVE